MSKTLKIILLSVIGPILLGIIANLTFKGVEYFSGGKFVSYPEENSETVSINGQFSYKLADEDINRSKLILVGEPHGVHEPTQFDVHFFKHLYNNFGVRTYFAEMDCAQAFKLNQFLESGDETLLKDILEYWVVAQGRNNQDYINKYMEFHTFYQQLPEGDKFQFLGVDKVRDWEFFTLVVNEISEEDSTLISLEFDKTKILAQLKERLLLLDAKEFANNEINLLVDQLQTSIDFYEEKTPREEAMFQNFKKYFIHYDLTEQRSYGFFGLYHIFQYDIDNEAPFAAQIRESDLGLERKILSMNFMFVDSHMVMKSNALPKFLQDDGPYTKMGISSDNLIVIYIYGIQDFKRMTAKNQKSFVKMNGDENPYSDTKRLNKIIQLLPVTNIFKMTDKGKEYVQYTIFVRNSDWAEPLADN